LARSFANAKSVGSIASTRPAEPTSWARGSVWAPMLAPMSITVAPGSTIRV
jgi:hypothetical protein